MRLALCGRCRRHARPGKRCPFCGSSQLIGLSDASLPDSAANVAAVYAPPSPVSVPLQETTPNAIPVKISTIAFKLSPAIQFYELSSAICTGGECGYRGIALAATGVTAATQVLVGGLVGAFAGYLAGRGKGRSKEGAAVGAGLAVVSELLTPQMMVATPSNFLSFVGKTTFIGLLPAAVGLGVYYYSRSEA